MKTKIIAVVLLLTLLLGAFAGCKESNDDGFQEVASVTYTVDGKKKTEKSVAYINIESDGEDISKEEYAAVDPKYQVSSGISTPLTALSREVSSISGFTNADKGQYVYRRYVVWGDVGFLKVEGRDYECRYLKYKIISEIQYSYIQVKVIDDDTIIVRNSSGDTTYNVSSYSITYFN